MAYFVLADIKFDLSIQGDAFDSTITNSWGPESDEEVDNRIYTSAQKARRILELPIVPLNGTVPKTIKSASDHFVKERYYKKVRNKEEAKVEHDAAIAGINAYVARLNVDAVWYGRLTGGSR
jgi:hypothetical protein